MRDLVARQAGSTLLLLSALAGCGGAAAAGGDESASLPTWACELIGSWTGILARPDYTGALPYSEMAARCAAAIEVAAVADRDGNSGIRVRVRGSPDCLPEAERRDATHVADLKTDGVVLAREAVDDNPDFLRVMFDAAGAPRFSFTSSRGEFVSDPARTRLDKYDGVIVLSAQGSECKVSDGNVTGIKIHFTAGPVPSITMQRVAGETLGWTVRLERRHSSPPPDRPPQPARWGGEEENQRMAVFRLRAETPLQRIVSGALGADPWAMAYLGRLHYVLSDSAVPVSRNVVAARDLRLQMRAAFLYAGQHRDRPEGRSFHTDFLAFLRSPDPQFRPAVGAAVEWSRSAARVDNPDGLVILGLLHELGDGLPASRSEALACWEKAAGSGSHEAACLLAARLGGSDQPVAHERALRLVRAACAAGEPQAHALLATFLRDGIGTPPDLAAALEALRNGAELGCPDALTCLAESHAIEFPAWRGSQDRAATLRFLRRAADADWPIALSRLIAGVAGEYWPDLGRAEVDGYMSRACTLGAVDAITTIGSCYELGKGVRPDDERAFVHYRAGYQLGDPVGALMYAEKLVQGRGGAAGVGVAAALLDDLLADRYLVPENKSWVREYAARLLADVRVSGTAGAKDPCSICSGRGWVPRVGLPPPSLTAGQPSSRMTCQGCYGSGRRL